MTPAPLIVLTGQGLAKADGFDLVARLQAEPEWHDAFFVYGREQSDDLDHVISAYRAAGEERLRTFIDRIRLECRIEREKTATKPNHQGIFKILATLAHHRAVLHLTTNIDGISTNVAVGEHRARWVALRERAAFESIVRDVDEVLSSGQGMIHLPLHGEAALMADGDGATILWTVRPEQHGAGNSTLAEGLGRGVQSIEARMHVSQLGYRLLRALLTGSRAELDFGSILGPYPQANLVTVGYGAGGGEIRLEYPFEKHIGQIPPRDCLSRTALVFEGATQEVRAWYSKNGFELVGHGSNDLVERFAEIVGQPIPYQDRRSPIP